MRTCPLSFSTSGLFIVLTLAACGGTAPRGAAEPAPAGSSSGVAHPASAASAAAAKPSETGAPKPEADDLKKLYRSPRDAITRKDVSYMIAFEDCDAGKAAAESCSKQSGGDPSKRSACMSKARAKLEMDGVRFGQDTAGDWYWITIQQKGNAFVAVHKIKVELGEENGNAITINPKGRDFGTKPMRQIPSKVVYEMESDYRMTTVDPQLGKLVFDVKIGMPNQ